MRSPCYLLHTIHEQVGHPAFITFFRSAQASFKWKFATTESLAGLLKVVTKTDFSDFIAQNYWGHGLPEWKK
jgi:hypothetical protein